MPNDLNLSPANSALAQWEAQARGAYATNTLRAWTSDWVLFSMHCQSHHEAVLPASAQVVRAFIAAQLEADKKPATIRRYIASISRAHRAAGEISPTSQEPVILALKEMGRSTSSRQRQARGLVWSEIAEFLRFEPRHLRDQRDQLLLALAYDTMCRCNELVNLRVENLTYSQDGAGSVLIERSKTDTTGAGALAYLSPLTVRRLTHWIGKTQLQSGPILRKLKGREVGEGLTAQSIADVFKKAGRWIGLPPSEWQSLSGHSARVGATQDLLALNIDLVSIMQTGRWKDTRMPLRYGEQVLTTRGGMARAAAAQGRL